MFGPYVGIVADFAVVAVVRDHHVLDVVLPEPAERVQPAGVRRVAVDLAAVGQRRVLRPQLLQRRDVLVHRRVDVVPVLAADRRRTGAVDDLVVVVVGGLRREHVLPRVLVTTRRR